MKASVQISHDGFARETLERMIHHVHPDHATCAWCGGNHAGHLFSYHTQPDDAKLQSPCSHAPKLFCSLSCFRAYYC